jgi:hypothetical protein
MTTISDSPGVIAIGKSQCSPDDKVEIVRNEGGCGPYVWLLKTSAPQIPLTDSNLISLRDFISSIIEHHIGS